MPVARVALHVVEVNHALTPVARVAHEAVEVLVARPTPSPTTVTGAGVSQAVAEVLHTATAMMHVSQVVLEVLVSGDGASGGSGSSPITTAFGYAV